MEQPEKELIQEIANLFEDYEEDYVPGEWESFSAGRVKNDPFFGLWIKVAAVLFLIISVLPYKISDLYLHKKSVELTRIKVSSDPVRLELPLNNQSHLSNNSRIVANSPRKSNSDIVPEKVVVNGISETVQVFKDSPALGNKKEEQAAFAVLQPKSNIQTLVSNKPVLINKQSMNNQVVGGIQPVVAEQLVLNNKALNSQYSSAAAKIPADKQKSLNDTSLLSKKEKRNTMEFLLAESRQPAKINTKENQPSKWDFGVEVAPTMTRSNMNIGGGLTTAYRLSDKFSLSSGVSLLQLESGMDVPVSAQAKMSVSSLSSKELLAVNANIKAIDIPLAVVFNVNKHFYTSAGISYFNVISEKRNNTYELTSQVSHTTTNPETGFSSFDRMVVNQSVSEAATETRLKGNSYLGFFNFSVGRRQTIFNKYNVLIEPFIKVPMGKLSTEDLKLTNSGLKFQFSF